MDLIYHVIGRRYAACGMQEGSTISAFMLMVRQKLHHACFIHLSKYHFTLKGIVVPDKNIMCQNFESNGHLIAQTGVLCCIISAAPLAKVGWLTYTLFEA